MKQLLLIIALLILGCKAKEPTTSQLQNGDLIFQTSLSNQSLAIQTATNSIYSHMGIIYKTKKATFVYEAVQPVKLTPLKAWINRGKNGKYAVKRLKQSKKVLTSAGIKKMQEIGQQHLGKSYDLKFKWSDDKMYCSELIWKMYKEAFNIEIGKLQRIKDFDLTNPIVQAKMKERYGGNIPLDELVITPDRMFTAKNLVTVIQQ